jgi:hypothetical protein
MHLLITQCLCCFGFTSLLLLLHSTGCQWLSLLLLRVLLLTVFLHE